MALRSWTRAELRDGVFYAVLAAGGTLLIVGPLSGADYLAARGLPREQAQVVAVTPSGTRVACGRSIFPDADGYEYRYRVTNPRPGLPEEYTVLDCPDFREIGDSDTIARSGPTSDDVQLHPPTSAAEAAGVALLLSAVVGGMVMAAYAAYALVGEVLGRVQRALRIGSPGTGRHRRVE